MKTIKVMLICVDNIFMLVSDNEIGNKNITIHATTRDDDKENINPEWLKTKGKIGKEYIIHKLNDKYIHNQHDFIYIGEIENGN